MSSVLPPPPPAPSLVAGGGKSNVSKKREVKFILRLYSWLRGPSDFFFFLKATADLFAFVILKGVAYVGRAQVPC